jgi:hypothetical protein
MLALALSLAAAVGLELQPPVDLPAGEVQILAAELSRALAAHPVAREAREETVRYVVDVGATRLQILAERLQGAVVVARAAQVGPRAVDQWSTPARALIDALYAGSTAEPTAVLDASRLPATDPAAARGPVPWGAWAVMGTGAALLAAGAGFAVSSASARAELGRGPVVVEPELGELTGRADTHGAVSLALSGAAVACAVAGVLWMLSESGDP